jgi:carbonic anhydrase
MVRQRIIESVKSAIPQSVWWIILPTLATQLRSIGQGPGSDAGDFINWLAFPDETSSVITDVSRIRNHPLVPRTVPVYGYVYDVRSGNLIEVPAATEIGASQA